MGERNLIDLRVLVISHYVPEFSSSFWFLRVTLGSFLRVFKLPDALVRSEIFIYLQCTMEETVEVTELGKTKVSSELMNYTRGIQANVQEITGGVLPVQHYCTGSLAAAQCHTVHVGGAKYIFLLEHDWFFPIGRVRHSLSELFDTMRASYIDYIRFNKRSNINRHADQPCLLNYNASHEVKLSFSATYSNNPHVADFLAYKKWFTAAMCKKSVKLDGRKWEVSLRAHCKPEEVRHGSCDNFKMLSQSLCQNYIYGKKKYRPTIIHLDGSNGKRNRWKSLVATYPETRDYM